MAAPTISLCVTAAGPAGRVQALLEMVRPHVDELVLAADRTGDPDTLDACAHLADRRLRFELRESPTRAIGWAMHQCRGDWILRIDDDEVPSADLLDSLPEMTAERRLTQIAFRRKWVYPDAGQYITSTPWGHEFLPRLVRNLPGLWAFDGLPHSAGEIAGERRLADPPLYHLVLVLASLEERRRKALGYESHRPGLMWDGAAVNGYYVPEAAAEIATEPVPERDRLLVRAMIDGEPPPAPTPAAAGPPIEDVDFRDVDRYNASRTVGKGAYRAAIEFVRRPATLPAGTVRHVELRVRNEGDERWPPGDAVEPLIRLGFRWRRAADARVVSDGRAVFTETVEPGQTTRVLLPAPTPSDPGDHVLEVDVVHEHVRWFRCAIALPVRIEAADQAGSAALRNGFFAAEIEQARQRLRREVQEGRLAAAGAQARLVRAQAVAASRRYRLAVALERPLGVARRVRNGRRG